MTTAEEVAVKAGMVNQLEELLRHDDMYREVAEFLAAAGQYRDEHGIPDAPNDHPDEDGRDYLYDRRTWDEDAGRYRYHEVTK